MSFSDDQCPPHIGVPAVEVGGDRVEDDQPAVAQRGGPALDGAEVFGRERGHPPGGGDLGRRALVPVVRFRLEHRRDDVHPVQIGARGQEPGDDGPRRVVLGGEQDRGSPGRRRRAVRPRRRPAVARRGDTAASTVMAARLLPSLGSPEKRVNIPRGMRPGQSHSAPARRTMASLADNIRAIGPTSNSGEAREPAAEAERSTHALGRPSDAARRLSSSGCPTTDAPTGPIREVPLIGRGLSPKYTARKWPRAGGCVRVAREGCSRRSPAQPRDSVARPIPSRAIPDGRHKQLR